MDEYARTMPPPAPPASSLTQGVFEATRFPGSDAPLPDGEDGGPLKQGEAFGPRYHIMRLLGIGGMGAVYQAWDAELGVIVAVKVIRAEVSRDAAAAQEIERRFKRELVLARQVTHKNVVRIHDLGEIDGIKYITMSFVDGEDLATALRRDRQLPITSILPLARQIVAGLQAAHEAGVVHRDLKPANIMIEGDRAIVMDFGIARSTGGPSVVTGAAAVPAVGTQSWRSATTRGAATMAGAVVGTIEYMAPEQARGQPVDQRADIYAFGLILYDLLLNRSRVEHATSAIAELQQRMIQPPPPVRSIVPAVPEALDQIVSRCIEPDPEKRYATTQDLAAALDRLDDSGVPLPVRRVVGLRTAIALGVLFVALLTGTWWYGRGRAVPPPHDPVSVLIADFQNTTGDATFDRTLEPMLKLSLEGAGFISAYDRSGIRRSLGMVPPERLDERAAVEIAVKQGLGAVLSGTIQRQGSGYAISVKAAEAVTGRVIVTATRTAAKKEQVLDVANRLAASVRKALGETSDSAQRFATQTFSATSFEVVRAYATAAEALSKGKSDEALKDFAKSVELDQNFGLGYAGMAIASRNLDRNQEAETYIKQAVSHVDGMTERERYRTRGLFYQITNDYQACVKEYGELISKYAADAPARNNLALCLTQLRELPKALDEMRQVIKILPKRVLYRQNLALYAAYSGDAKAAAAESRAMAEPGWLGLLPLAFAQVLDGQLPAARETYKSMAKTDDQGASYAASGLADLALYQGRLAEAARLFTEGAAADVAEKATDPAANKFAALAYTQLLRHQNAAAIAAANSALANSQAVKIRFLAARVLVEAGSAAAKPLAAGLGSELLAEPQAYAKIIEGESALKDGRARDAIKLLIEANTLLDTWMGHLDLGRAYLEAGAFTQADSEFDRCIKRRGEALALFLDEEPTIGLFPPVYYYQGRVREGLKSAGAAESYRAYLDIRGSSNDDPLLPDVRRRAGR